MTVMCAYGNSLNSNKYIYLFINLVDGSCFFFFLYITTHHTTSPCHIVWSVSEWYKYIVEQCFCVCVYCVCLSNACDYINRFCFWLYVLTAELTDAMSEFEPIPFKICQLISFFISIKLICLQFANNFYCSCLFNIFFVIFLN